ncbi:TetR/AcrR family transcriptional regulator [Allorhizocola rhizosphaerae]|uniref:TetR/AcrR family transcriptional regulator n=1 Tax=Allorhizocola rhizosphaerae TaxID=1872709 RepID=UPI000E3D09B7|nr:TetR/AcrR family transcriptional regulator [Allorhizocola rhizosphaerae]
MSDRSQRRREATLAEIKAVARQHLVAGGPSSISLRAIARDMGMTAPALYRYYASLDALVLDLCTDLYTELRIACEAVRDAVPDGVIEKLHAMAREFRRWVLAHPAETALMFGPPLPGVNQFIDGCNSLQDAGHRFGRIFTDLMVELYRQGRLPDVLVDLPAHEDLPPSVTALFLKGWTRLYGVIMAEAFGHLNWALTDATALFESELADMTADLRSR